MMEAVRAFLVLVAALVAALALGVGLLAVSGSVYVGAASPDGAPGIHLSAHRPCPSSVPANADVRNGRPGLSGALVLHGATFGLVCRYSGSGLPLASHAALSGRALRVTEALIARLHLGIPRGAVSCPAGFESVTYFVFSYPAGSEVDLRLLDTGCASLDNGFLVASEVGNSGGAFRALLLVVEELAPEATTNA